MFRYRWAAVAACWVLLSAGMRGSADAATTCISKRVPVPQLSQSTYVRGSLCTSGHLLSDDVLVLVPGATYDGRYWNVALDRRRYNFRLAMNRAGYATFDLDRLGTGHSNVPPSVLVTHQLQAAAVHDAIRSLTPAPFTGAITVGHSLGSATVVTEAAAYHDEVAVLLTGFSHIQNPEGFTGLATSLEPADLDPSFATWDPGYLTTIPGRRGFLYGDGDLTPAIRAYDQSIKQPVSGVEIATAFGTIAPIRALPSITQLLKIPPTGGIAVPVLSINGAEDRLFCNSSVCASSTAYRHSEAPYYRASPHFQAWILPNAGHDINLAADTPLYQRRAIAWLRNVAP